MSELIKKLFESKLILTRGPDYPHGFKLKSGQRSNIYINIRDLIKNPAVFNQVIFELFQLIINNIDKAGTCVLGIPTMGAVLSPIMAYKLCRPLVVIRQHQKDHGVGSTIEGTLTNKIILVDDVITSGLSINEVLKTYVEPQFGQNYELFTFVIVDREEHTLKNIQSLTTLHKIETEIRKKKYSNKQKETL